MVPNHQGQAAREVPTETNTHTSQRYPRPVASLLPLFVVLNDSFRAFPLSVTRKAEGLRNDPSTPKAKSTKLVLLSSSQYFTKVQRSKQHLNA